MFRLFKIALLICTATLTLTCVSSDAGAQIRNPNKETEKHDVGVDEHLNALLPLDARFVKEDGNVYTLSHFFESGKPIVLTMNYSDCPMLCNLQLTKLVEALRGMELKPGVDFEIVSISIDPREGPIKARDTKDKYVTLYDPEKSAEQAWHFLTGRQEDIQRLATTVGFRYEYVRATKEYVHPPLFVMVSPEGRVMRYVHGVDFEPAILQQALTEAGAGQSGNSISEFIYSCFLDRSFSGKYSMNAMKTMRAAGGMTALVLICTLLPFWFSRKAQAQNRQQNQDNDQTQSELS